MHKPNPDLVAALVPAFAGFVVFGGFGLYLQLQGWNEKVFLKDGSILWIDYFGKPRVQCPYGELQDLKCSIASGSANSRSLISLTFFTPQGQFSANSNLHHFDDLRSDMAKLITEVREKRKHLEA